MRTRSPHPFPCRRLLPAVLLVTLVAACGGGAPEEDAGTPPPTAASGAPSGGADAVFRDAAAAAGLDFHHFNGASGGYFMVEILGAGGALFDYDGDGDLDVYLVQGAMLGPGRSLDDAVFPPHHPTPLSDRLYRNDLDGDGLRFTDVTEESGIGRLATGYGMGVAAGDYDGDGDLDLYLTNFGPNQLLRNRGDGTFEDVTVAAGAGDDGWSVPAAFFDYDGDGDLDLFVGNYVDFDFAKLPVCRDLTGAQDYCGPKVFDPQADRLLRNRGDGSFEDVSAAAGLAASFGPALGVVAADFDDDGRPDLYVANDARANNLWMNRGDGTFEDRALLAGAAVDASGKPQGSMGVDAGDFDGDGDLDLFMTHIAAETNTLYRNDGSGMFEDDSAATGLGAPSLPFTAFGTAWFDYDNDGWLDLMAVNGAVTKILSQVQQGDPYPLHQPNQLFHNAGGRFTDVSAEAGEAFRLSDVSRGAAFGDVDDDGDADVLVTNNNGPARLLLNQVGNAAPWLGVRLLLADGRRTAVGARAAVLVDGAAQRWRRVRPEGSYAVANDPRLLFGLGGLGTPPHLDAVRVVWPDGSREDFPVAAVGRYVDLVQGQGREQGQTRRQGRPAGGT